MSGLRSALFVLAGLGCCLGRAAAADEPPPDGAPPAMPLPPVSTVPVETSPLPPPLVARPPSAPHPPPGPDETPAREAPPSLEGEARFGDAGEVVLNGVLSASFGHLGYDASASTSTTVGLQPAFDYFSSANVSEGGSAFLRYSDSRSGIEIGSRSLTFGVTGQVGFNCRFGDRISFWPKLAVGIWQSRSTYSAPFSSGSTVSIDGLPVPISVSREVTENAVFVQLYAPFLLHVVQHFFLGFGPDLYVDVLHSVESMSNRRAFLGASSTVGGWF